tara:strand:- start:2295 stop:4745 length:2451 start_codon:yes stop_codon:yes gene_type:complete
MTDTQIEITTKDLTTKKYELAKIFSDMGCVLYPVDQGKYFGGDARCFSGNTKKEAWSVEKNQDVLDNHIKKKDSNWYYSHPEILVLDVDKHKLLDVSIWEKHFKKFEAEYETYHLITKNKGFHFIYKLTPEQIEEKEKFRKGNNEGCSRLGIDGYMDICFLENRISVGGHSLCKNKKGELCEYKPEGPTTLQDEPGILNMPNSLWCHWLKRCHLKKNQKTKGSGEKKPQLSKEEMGKLLSLLPKSTRPILKKLMKNELEDLLIECHIGKHIKSILKNKLIITDNSVQNKREFYWYDKKEKLWSCIKGEKNLENKVRKVFDILITELKRIKKANYRMYKMLKRELEIISTGCNIKSICNWCNQYWYNPEFKQNLDFNPNIICFKNGLLELGKKCNFREYRRDDYVTQKLSYDFKKYSQEELDYDDGEGYFTAENYKIIDKYYETTHHKDKEANKYWTAYNLTGLRTAEKHMFFIGAGSGGKTTKYGIMKNVMEFYVGNVPSNFFTTGNTDYFRQLRGVRSPCRYVNVNEASVEGNCDTDHFKINCDKVSTQSIKKFYSDQNEMITFQAKFNIMLNKVALPHGKDGQMDSGIKRRVMMTSMKGKFVDTKEELAIEKCYNENNEVHLKDNTLVEKFEEENMKNAFILYHLPYIEGIYKDKHLPFFQNMNKRFINFSSQKDVDIDLRKIIVLPTDKKIKPKLRFTINQLQKEIRKRFKINGHLPKKIEEKIKKQKDLQDLVLNQIPALVWKTQLQFKKGKTDSWAFEDTVQVEYFDDFEGKIKKEKMKLSNTEWKGRKRGWIGGAFKPSFCEIDSGEDSD